MESGNFSNPPKPQETFVESSNSKLEQENLETTPPSKTVLKEFIGENDRYCIEKFLSSGMSMVYLGSDTKCGDKPLVIKIITPSENQKLTKHLIKRFEVEISILASLNSLHIVQVKDFGLTAQNSRFAGTPFYVMEYLKGQTLTQRLKEVKFLSFEQALSIVIQICSGLQEAHQQNIVHRDLKPDNIILVPVEELGELVKIIDFGIAKKINNTEQPQLTKFGSFIGTYRYASPEQCEGNPEIDQRSDIYSLGLILYEMLTGRSPYNVPVELEERSWVRYHLIEKPISLMSYKECENLPSALEAIIMQCLEKSKAKRFSNISKLKQALKAVLVEYKNELEKKPLIEYEQPEPPQLIQNNEYNYTRLRELLAAGAWKEADEETAALMLKVAGREKEKYLDISSLTNFPCDVLKAIDRLWQKYSNGKFGLTTQQKIWHEVGGKIDFESDYNTGYELGRSLGWIRNNRWLKFEELNFTLEAPYGHLPEHWRLTWDASLIVSCFARCKK